MQRRKFMAAGLGLFAAGAAWTLTDPALRGVLTAQVGGKTMSLVRGADLGFGTVISVQVVHADTQLAERAIHDALQAARQVDQLMSLYRESSQVSQLNRDGVLNDPHPQLVEVLRAAQQLSQQSEGGFDITIQPLWQAAANDQSSPALLAHRRAQVDWRRVQVDEQRIAFEQPGMAITLNGIAQGYATDRALAALLAHGISHALVDIGEYAAIGERETQQPWQLGIQHPRQPDTVLGSVPLAGRALSTSGDYNTRFGADYQRHHILDPHTGASPQELASVSVLAPTAMLADGLSTACMVLGIEKSLALIASLPQTAALFIDKAGQQTASAGWHWNQG